MGDVVWVVEATDETSSNKCFSSQIVGYILESLDTWNRLQICFLYILNPQLSDSQRILDDILKPEIKRIEDRLKNVALPAAMATHASKLLNVVASCHVEVNEKRDVGLQRAAEFLKANCLYITDKLNNSAMSIDSQSDYSSQGIPPGCGLVMINIGAGEPYLLTQVLESSKLTAGGEIGSSDPASESESVTILQTDMQETEFQTGFYFRGLKAQFGVRHPFVDEYGPEFIHESADLAEPLPAVQSLHLDEQTLPFQIESEAEKEQEMAVQQCSADNGQQEEEMEEAQAAPPATVDDSLPLGQLNNGGRSQDVTVSEGFQEFSAAAILQMCRGFDESLVIGEGRFGTVYRGTYAYTTVAVKRFKDEQIASVIASFKREGEVHSSLRHPNIVLLMGHCKQPACLVYEFMAQGSLQDRLRGSSALSWIQRFYIFEGVCLGLLYLHTRHIRLEIKSANILLDKNLTPKLSDVGIAQFIADAPSSQQVPQSVGTVGYLSTYHGRFDDEPHVFSLGQLLKDLLMGHNSVGESEWHRVMEWVGGHSDNDQTGAVLDIWPSKIARRLCELATECCREGMNRPQLDSGVLKVIDELKPSVEGFDKEEQQKLESLRLLTTQSNLSTRADPPSDFCCPITKDIMLDPVSDCNGHTYERSAIEKWVSDGGNSPITGIHLWSKVLTPNFSLKSLIDQWKRDNSYIVV